MLQQMGITPDRTIHEKKPSLRTVAIMVRAGVRMRRGAEQWAKSRKIHERLVATLEVMRRKSRKSSAF
jgi:Pericentrin-AKAP-450 domain of centrosomal targeting protein